MSADSDPTWGPAISPSLIVGIVILAAFVIIIIAASVFRFCRQGSNTRSADGTTFDGSLDNMDDIDLFNPNQIRHESQTARMKEVRWINNMYAWERGRQARLETGELRPTTMIAGNRKGEMRNWDEWSVWESRESMANQTGDYSGAAYFYNVDDPYAPSSHQRLSHAASVLLPQPVNLNLNHGYRDSRVNYAGSPLRSQRHAATDIAVVGDDDMEELAAGVGVGLGLGSGHHTAAQQAMRENANGNVKGKNRNSALT